MHPDGWPPEPPLVCARHGAFPPSCSPAHDVPGRHVCCKSCSRRRATSCLKTRISWPDFGTTRRGFWTECGCQCCWTKSRMSPKCSTPGSSLEESCHRTPQSRTDRCPPTRPESVRIQGRGPGSHGRALANLRHRMAPITAIVWYAEYISEGQRSSAVFQNGRSRIVQARIALAVCSRFSAC